MKQALCLMMIALLGLGTFGCRHTEPFIEHNDEVLIYQLPYDLTYLRTMEALQMHDEWEIEETEKEFGVITVRNIAYGNFGDADKRKIVFNIKSMALGKTSVMIEPEYQHVPGGNKLMELVASYLSRASLAKS